MSLHVYQLPVIRVSTQLLIELHARMTFDLMSYKICDEFYKAGKIASGVCKKSTIPKKKFCKTVRRYQIKSVNKWFTPECENMRNEYMSLSKSNK